MLDYYLSICEWGLVWVCLLGVLSDNRWMMIGNLREEIYEYDEKYSSKEDN